MMKNGKRNFKKLKDLIPKIKEFEGKLGESAETLYNALQFQDKLLERGLESYYTYSHMRYDQDTTNSFYQGLDDRMKNLLFTSRQVSLHLLFRNYCQLMKEN